MADLKDCINAAVADGHMSQEAAEDYSARFDDLADDGAERGLSFHESRTRAAQRLQAEIEREIVRKKRMKLKQAAVTDRIRQRLAAAPVGRKDRAAVSVLDFDPRLEFVGDNVAMRHQSLRGSAFALMTDFVDRYRSKTGGLRRETASIEDVVKGLFGEKTTPEAKALAEGIHEARTFLVGRHNAAGGDILRRSDWGWVQHHERAAIARAGKDVWKEFTRDRIDFSRMLDSGGEPMTARQIDQALDATYDRIITGDLAEMAGTFDPKFGSPVNARIAHRELVFRDARTWFEYQQRFGSGDIFGAIVGEIDRLSRDVAQIEVLGPYPRATLETLKNIVDADRGQAALSAEGKKAAKMAEKIGRHRMLDAVFDQVTGTANIPASGGWARASQSNRNLITAARLGSALFVSIGDVATNALTANMSGVPLTRLMGQLFRQMNPASAADRRMAARAGYISETWIGHAVAAQRLMGEVSGAASTAQIADTVLRLSGLSWWTDAGRAAFRLEFIGHMTDQANKAFNDVEPALRHTLEKYGITPDEWDLYRSTPIWTDAETGAEFIRPESVWQEFVGAGIRTVAGEHDARFNAAQKFGEMVYSEGYFAVVSPTARARAITTGGTQPGTFWGEVIRNMTLFRSFSVSFAHLHLSRMMAERGIASKAKYLAWITIGMTMGGAIAEQASAISRGKDPRDMSDGRFWASAVIRGGSFGPLGDFLYSSTSRHGANLAEGLLGPVLGSQLMQGVRLTIGNVQDLFKSGEARNAVPEFQRFADGLLPGRTLWYGRLAFERLIADELASWLDPDHARRFSRMESRARREFNQRYWWRPGRSIPDRAPEIGAMAGAE